jgi:hypothetical protein
MPQADAMMYPQQHVLVPMPPTSPHLLDQNQDTRYLAGAQRELGMTNSEDQGEFYTALLSDPHRTLRRRMINPDMVFKRVVGAVQSRKRDLCCFSQLNLPSWDDMYSTAEVSRCCKRGSEKNHQPTGTKNTLFQK